MGASATVDTVDGLVISRSKKGSHRMTQVDECGQNGDVIDGQLQSRLFTCRSKDDAITEEWLKPQRYDTIPAKFRILIVCNVNFDPRTRQLPRDAGLMDVSSIEMMCGKLGMPIDREDILIDASFNDIFEKMKSVAKEDHSNTSALMVFVMSHGKEEGMIWSRDHLYNVNDLVYSFSPSYAQGLKGKPKLFFVQACRGDGFDSGSLIEMSDQEAHERFLHDNFPVTYSSASPDSSGVSSGFPTKSHGQSHINQLPSEADFLIAYSTCEGLYSWRNRFLGSWFIQDLVSVFLSQSYNSDLLALLTQVNRKNAYNRQSNDQSNLRFHQKKQIPCFVHTLTKQLFLTN